MSVAGRDDSRVVGIRLLREAEARGHQLILAARDRKTRRVREARLEAEAEIKQFRDECEAVLREKQALIFQEEVLRSAEIVEKTKDELKTMEERVQACSPQVVDLLERLVSRIEPDIHHNLHFYHQIEAGHQPQVNLRLDKIVEEIVNKCLSNCELIAFELISNNNNYSSSDV